jgi:hypothetical protein
MDKKLAAGVAYLGAGGAVIFPQNTFTQTPVVVCSVMRSANYVFNSSPVNVYVTDINKDSASYTVKGVRKPGDQISWIAVGL